MIDQPFRNILPNHTKSLIQLYQRLGLSPNQITLGALFLATVASVFVSWGWSHLAILVWWAGRLFDGTDGIYARSTGQTSDFGAFWDILADMASYSLMLFGFGALHPELHNHWLIIMFMYVLCITGALALGAIEERLKIDGKDNRGVRLAAGLAEGGETGIAYSLFLLIPSSIELLANIWIVILVSTVLARIWLARTILRGQH